MERGSRKNLHVLKAIIDESKEGMRLFDSAGRVIHQNAVADGLLANAAVIKAVDAICRSAIEMGGRTSARLNGFLVTASVIPRSSLGIMTLRHSADMYSDAEIQEKFKLSFREAQVLRLLAARRTDEEIARALGISWHTVRTHVQSVFAALGCHSRREVSDRLS